MRDWYLHTFSMHALPIIWKRTHSSRRAHLVRVLDCVRHRLRVPGMVVAGVKSAMRADKTPVIEILGNGTEDHAHDPYNLSTNGQITHRAYSLFAVSTDSVYVL